MFLKDNWNTATFVTNYIPLMFAPVLFIAATVVMKARFVKAEDMDFITGLDAIEADTYDEPPPKNLWEAIWQKLVRLHLYLLFPSTYFFTSFDK